MALYYNGDNVSSINFTPQLTLAEYNALSIKPKYWIRTDGDELTGIPADEISYDNTDSELTSTNVQDAIDEVDGKIDNLNSTTESIQTTLGFNYFNLFTMKEILSGSNINAVDLKINYKANNATYSGFLFTRHSTYILHGACNNDASAMCWTLKQLDDAGSSEVVTITQDTTDQFKFIIKSSAQWNARFLVLLHGSWIPNLTHEQRQNLFILNNPRLIN